MKPQAGPLESTPRRVHANILETIGNTPLVRLNKVTRGLDSPIYAKLEYFNPGGSVKDRIAERMLESHERSGVLRPGGIVVEATSGNTGVGLALACALKGYQAIFVMPDKMSQEKIQLLRAFGARVVLAPTAVPPDDPRSYYSVADRIVRETPNAVLADQYHNPANPESHYLSTAPEIWAQTQGRVTHIVVGMGTGGTISGIARYMREHGHAVRIVGVDPVGSLLYEAWRQGGPAGGLQTWTYKVEGIGEDFIPSTLDLSLVDEVHQVDDAEAFRWTRRLVREEGIFCGGSSGAALAGALRTARGLGPEHCVVVIFPDSGSRYLSKVFNDDWMREHGFLVTQRGRVPVGEVAEARGQAALITAGPQDRLLEVIGRMRQHGVSQLPVVDADGRLLGLVSEVDLLDHMLNSDHDHLPNETIAGMVNDQVSVAGPEDPLDQVLPDLLTRKVVVLTDEGRRPSGILTVIDALEFVASGGGE